MPSKIFVSADPPQSSPQTPGTNVPPAAVPEKVLTNFVEAGGSYHQLTNGFGVWSGGYARGVLANGKEYLECRSQRTA